VALIIAKLMNKKCDASIFAELLFCFLFSSHYSLVFSFTSDEMFRYIAGKSMIYDVFDTSFSLCSLPSRLQMYKHDKNEILKRVIMLA